MGQCHLVKLLKLVKRLRMEPRITQIIVSYKHAASTKPCAPSGQRVYRKIHSSGIRLLRSRVSFEAPPMIISVFRPGRPWAMDYGLLTTNYPIHNKKLKTTASFVPVKLLKKFNDISCNLRYKFKGSCMSDLFEYSLLPLCLLGSSSDFEENRGGSEENPRRQSGSKEYSKRSAMKLSLNL